MSSMIEEVILVNTSDEQIGVMEKIEAHEKALLHRAFSIFIFNSNGEMLLQQRALAKYHSPGLWTNACCSHPRPGENINDAAMRRLQEELGFQTKLHKVFDFTYRATFDNGLTEHEFDHVFVGSYNNDIHPNENEVMNISYQSIENIRDSLFIEPAKYTAWFQIAFPKIYSWWQSNYSSTKEL
jgi:isopentenyl-diphosphate delta-isomerase